MRKLQDPTGNAVIVLVDTMIQEAITIKASDIHLEPTETGLRVRFRIDGVLYDKTCIEKAVMAQVISRIKIVANINIAEKRLPQDGKFSIIHHKHTIDFRVSTFPSMYGEKIVIRILDRMHNKIALESLGMQAKMLEQFKQLLEKSHGFFLVTGPTGAGKTTTLYAALSSLHAPDKNIITLEDPVEYTVEGVTQGHINNEVGFTFSKGIRAILRQDPDILMVGEIRDKETAGIAIEAALTGHVVLSTLHTNDAPGVIMRLLDMGVEPFLINAAITGVLAQRLARKLCQECKIQAAPDELDQKLLRRFGLELDRLYKSKGCDACARLGYKGRTGIFQLLSMTSSLRSLIIEKPHFDTIHERALSDGMQLLFQDGMAKVQEGIISLQELVRTVV